jgi:hypothetical protein
MQNKVNSTDLFKMPSFKKGLTRPMNLFPNLKEYKYSKTGEDADKEALAKDWAMIGQDILKILENYGNPRKNRTERKPSFSN